MALTPDQYQTIADEAVANNVDPRLVYNVVQAESSGNQYDARGNVLTSPTGARGLMQLEPGTARDMGVNPDDPNDNIRGGVRYLAQLQNKYGADNPHLIAAAYNGGPRHVDEGTVSPAAHAYAEKVTQGLSRPDDDVDPAFAGLGGSAAPRAQAPSQGQGQPAGYNPDTDVDPAFAGISQRAPGTPGGPQVAMGNGQIVDQVTHGVVPMGAQNVAQALGIKAYKADDPNAPTNGSRDMPYYAKPGEDPNVIAEGEYVIVPTSNDYSSGQLVTKKDGKLVVEKSFGDGLLQGAMHENNNLIRFGNTITGGKLPMLNDLDQKANAYDARTAANDQLGVGVGSGLGKFTGGAGLAGLDTFALGEAGLLPKAGLTGAAVQGAVGGGLLTDARDPAGVLGDMALGAAGGTVLHGAAKGAGAVLLPRLAPAVQAMRDAGVQLTPGGMFGGFVKSAEDKLTSAPFVGDAVKAAQRASVESFNRGTANQVLSPIGESVGKTTAAGHDMVDEVASKISDRYKQILPHVSLDVNGPDIMSGLANVEQTELLGVPSQIKDQFRNILFDSMSNRVNGGTMPGSLYQDFDSVLGSKARQYAGSTDGDQRALGQALEAAQGVFKDALADQNPAAATDLRAANTAWAGYVRLRDAASRLGTDEGVYTPKGLRGAVRANDSSAGHGAFAKGDAMLQDWAQNGVKTVGNSYPDSGSAGRGAEIFGLLHPFQLAKTVVGALPALGVYGTNAGREAANWVLTAPKGTVAAAVGRALQSLPAAVKGVPYPALRHIGLQPPSPQLPQRR